MAAKTKQPALSAPKRPHVAHPPSRRVLVIESRFYENIADELIEGAVAELEACGASYERIAVPGALEIPQALNAAVAAGLIPKDAPAARFCGAVALGCVIRGETSHYDIVCRNANHWLMEVAIRHNVPVGNGILTVDSEAQALARARGGRKGKGGDAVRACLKLIGLSLEFEIEGA